MKILSISDVLIPFIYSAQVSRRFSNIDLVIDCGDLPYYYDEYIISALNVDLFFVRGNHSKEAEFTTGGIRQSPLGGSDLHRKLINYRGLLMAGVEGSLRYRNGPFQYSQGDMWMNVFHLVPGLFYNRMRYGRYLDVFVSHAPPRGTHDQTDLPHQGIDAFRWLIQVFKPAYYFHGHIHVYRPDTQMVTQVSSTQVINTLGYRVTEVIPGKCPSPAD